MLFALLAVALDAPAVFRALGFSIWLVLTGVALFCGLAFVASRDALRKYYERTGALPGD